MNPETTEGRPIAPEIRNELQRIRRLKHKPPAAYIALVEQAVALGLPKAYPDDLITHDLRQITKDAPPCFVWGIYETGTHLFYPHAHGVEALEGSGHTFVGIRYFAWEERLQRLTALPDHAQALRSLKDAATANARLGAARWRPAALKVPIDARANKFNGYTHRIAVGTLVEAAACTCGRHEPGERWAYKVVWDDYPWEWACESTLRMDRLNDGTSAGQPVVWVESRR